MKPPARTYVTVLKHRHGRVEQSDDRDKVTRIVWNNPPAHRSPVLYVAHSHRPANRLKVALDELEKGPVRL